MEEERGGIHWRGRGEHSGGGAFVGDGEGEAFIGGGEGNIQGEGHLLEMERGRHSLEGERGEGGISLEGERHYNISPLWLCM